MLFLFCRKKAAEHEFRHLLLDLAKETSVPHLRSNDIRTPFAAILSRKHDFALLENTVVVVEPIGASEETLLSHAKFRKMALQVRFSWSCDGMC